MAIKVKDIPPEGLSLELDQNVDLFETGTASTPCKAVLAMTPTGGGSFHLSGRIQSELQLDCSRCLKKFTYAVDTNLSVEVSPLSAMDRSPEHELTGGELETEFYQSDEIEPLDFVKEQVLISIPMVPVHSLECKGLCPHCGTDLNAGECGCKSDRTDGFGPFSDLKALFNKKKE